MLSGACRPQPLRLVIYSFLFFLNMFYNYTLLHFCFNSCMYHNRCNYVMMLPLSEYWTLKITFLHLLYVEFFLQLHFVIVEKNKNKQPVILKNTSYICIIIYTVTHHNLVMNSRCSLSLRVTSVVIIGSRCTDRACVTFFVHLGENSHISHIYHSSALINTLTRQQTVFTVAVEAGRVHNPHTMGEVAFIDPVYWGSVRAPWYHGAGLYAPASWPQ